MATRIRNKRWADDQSLEEALWNYNRQGLQRKWILSFTVREFLEYTWSLCSLDRRFSYFNINRSDKSVSVEDIKSAINKELKGLGRLLRNRPCNAFKYQKYSWTEYATGPCIWSNGRSEFR